jgi:hypothetical protein
MIRCFTPTMLTLPAFAAKECVWRSLASNLIVAFLITALLMSGPLMAAGLDSDNDGLSDSWEMALGTDYLLADTDLGGTDDGDELAAGSDPLDAEDDSTTGEMSVSFQDVSIPAGLGGFRMESWGAAWADINNDYYPDLFMSDHRMPGRFYQNDGNGAFSNKSSYVDLSKAFYNSTRDSHAAAWADFDNDGDTDLGMAIGAIGSLGSLLVNNAGRLTENRNAAGLNNGVGGEQRMPIFFDFNNDGLLDVKVINFKESNSMNTLFRQNSNHTFTQISNSAGIRCINSDWAQFMDINGSGQLEILCGDRNGVFPIAAYDYTSGYGVKLPLSQTTLVNDAIAADLNNDLRPDLVEIRGRLRIDQIHQADNQSVELHALVNYTDKRTFTIKTTGTLSFSVNANGTKNWLWPGKDDDGVLNDIYIGASGYHPGSVNISLNPLSSANQGIQNPGSTDGLFIGFDPQAATWTLVFNTTRQYSYAYLAITSSALITSVDGTGYELGNIPMKPKFLLNSGGNFVDVSDSNGFIPELCISGIAGDFDNDMDQDLYFACRNGAQNLKNVFYENMGFGQFRRIYRTSGAEGNLGAALAANAGNSETVVTADYDIDGFLDLLVTNGLNMAPKGVGGDEQLFRNLGNSNNWLELDLVGVQSNRDGMGAKILVTAGGVTQYREQNGGYHRWAQNHQRIHVGLGSNSNASEIQITWPSGRIDRYYNVAANALYKITEAQGITATVTRASAN